MRIDLRPTQHALHETHDLPSKSGASVVVGVGAFLSSLRGLELVPSKWRPLVPSTSG
jgi:hypothetical protein